MAWSKGLFVLALALLVPSPEIATEPPPEPAPRRSGLVETTAARLAQIDVTLTGSRDVIDGLRKEDFEVKIDHRKLPDFLIDRICAAGASAPRPGEPAAPRPESPALRPVSYMLYFDHPHLTMPGRQRAIDLARELVPTLLSGGNRAMIVSNARGVTTFANFTSSLEQLLAALERLEENRDEWDFYPEQETERMAQVVHALNKDGTDRAVAQARIFYMEDRWRGERDAQRLAMSLGLLAEVDPPKAVLYFSDTTRDNPGDFYLKMFSDSTLVGSSSGDEISFVRNASPDPANLLDRVVQEASAHGIRFYPIEARGLVAPVPSGLSMGATYSAANQKIPTAVAVEDVQESLRSLARETGGTAFLNGVPAERIARRVLDDLSCMFLISFDPEGFPEDGPLAVLVRVNKPGVSVQTRGQLVIQSESERKTSKLMSAFLLPEGRKSDVPIRTGIIPTGYEKGRFSALVQVAVAGGEIPGRSWDLGASLVAGERVAQEGSGRISVGVAGAPAVFEREMAFSPGRWELVSVAHETTTGQVSSRRDEGSWPDPDAAEAVVGPISVVQQVHGAFVRAGKTRTAGSLAQPEEALLRIDRPTAVIGIVCRGKRYHGPLNVERSLEGESSAAFPVLHLELGEERCAVFRDIVPPRTLGEGYFRYSVRVLGDREELARGARTFRAGAPAS